MLSKETYAGLLLILATWVALLMSNTALYSFYQSLFYIPFIEDGQLVLSKPLSVWINDGLMTIFFFLVGLELKKERKVGELREIHKILMPAVAALGGVICPMLTYALLNGHNPEYNHGWAIPMATDIAFSVGVLSCFESRVPPRIRIFLLTLAVLDDLAAIIIIAIFYGEPLQGAALFFACLSGIGLSYLNRKKSDCWYGYLLLGLSLWLSILYSGIHATISGVILAFFIPLENSRGQPILETWVHHLKPWVNFVILPVFALANAGVHLEEVGWSHLLHPIILGVFLGLMIGKPLGVVIFSKLYMKVIPHEAHLSLQELIMIGLLAGIGFTMSLFIAGLSFHSQKELLDYARVGILCSSLGSMVLGAIALGKWLPEKKEA